VLRCVRGQRNDDRQGRNSHKKGLGRDRRGSGTRPVLLVNEALKAYIDVHQWQVDHIRQGLREANAGKFASDAEVKRVTSRLRRK